MFKKLVSTTTLMLVVSMLFGTLTFAATGKEIASRADNYLGDFRYKFGAEPWNSGYRYSDCSSFTKLVFKREGVYLPRTSRQQAKKGYYVAKRNLVKGDLVFFDTNDDGRINHVGIYMGRGRFIHSAPSNKVGFNNLNYGFWEDHYVTARRVR
ncbi:C40 family peptidase [Paenibacillus alkalitolerans]|uniref:C40 family peptidase n=1 Tax=Paenibacillus alkalitolerans TaxID=2799335 RepID=UPI0018F743BD|nr:C40 family peptidase [Paenibacillus alkalitolerans]